MYNAGGYEYGVSNTPPPQSLYRYSSASPLSIPSTSSSPAQFSSASSASPVSPASLYSLPSTSSGLLEIANEASCGLNQVREPTPEESDSAGCMCKDDTCFFNRNDSRTPSSTLSQDYLLSPSAGTPSPPLRAYQSSPSQVMFCDRHPNDPSYFCETCRQSFCAKCHYKYHASHVMVPLIQALEAAVAQARQAIAEAKSGEKVLYRYVQNVPNSVNILQSRAETAASKVMSVIANIRSALDQKQRDLLQEIENQKNIKTELIIQKEKFVMSNINTLNQIVSILRQSIIASQSATSPMNLVVAKDMACAKLFEIRQGHNKRLSQREENWITFNGDERALMDGIAKLDIIGVKYPGSIGDGRDGRRPDVPQSITIAPLAPQPPVNSNQSPPKREFPGIVFGDSGRPSRKLCRPWGVACDTEGNIVVGDRSNNQIMVFRENGSFVRRFGTLGPDRGEFNRPAGVAIDKYRRIIVADKDNHRVQVFTMRGKYLNSFGGKGTERGKFNYPWDVAVNSRCEIVVSDTRNHRIQLFSSSGIFLKKFGTEEQTPLWKTLESPRGVAFTPEGHVAVTDFTKQHIVIIHENFENFRVLLYTVEGKSQLDRPQGLFVDSNGILLVSNCNKNRIEVIDHKTGVLEAPVKLDDTTLHSFDRPAGVAVTARGRLVVIDFGNNRGVIF